MTYSKYPVLFNRKICNEVKINNNNTFCNVTKKPWHQDICLCRVSCKLPPQKPTQKQNSTLKIAKTSKQVRNKSRSGKYSKDLQTTYRCDYTDPKILPRQHPFFVGFRGRSSCSRKYSDRPDISYRSHYLKPKSRNKSSSRLTNFDAPGFEGKYAGSRDDKPVKMLHKLTSTKSLSFQDQRPQGKDTCTQVEVVSTKPLSRLELSDVAYQENNTPQLREHKHAENLYSPKNLTDTQKLRRFDLFTESKNSPWHQKDPIERTDPNNRIRNSNPVKKFIANDLYAESPNSPWHKTEPCDQLNMNARIRGGGNNLDAIKTMVENDFHTESPNSPWHEEDPTERTTVYRTSYRPIPSNAYWSYRCTANVEQGKCIVILYKELGIYVKDLKAN